MNVNKIELNNNNNNMLLKLNQLKPVSLIKLEEQNPRNVEQGEGEGSQPKWKPRCHSLDVILFSGS